MYPRPSTKLDDPKDFSIVLGGPLYQLLRRVHLSGNSLERVRRRVLFIAGLAWLPLLLLSTLEGHGLRGEVPVPFIFDAEAHIRFLVALPLLIVAELIVHRRTRLVARRFLERGLIPQTALWRFDAAIESDWRLRNSITAELLLVALVYVVGVAFWRHFIALPTTRTWYAQPTATGLELSGTGVWYVYVSLPIFQFLLVRWYYRIAIWARFLWQVSRIKLSLIVTHPDRLGGLGFLGQTGYALAPIAVAHGAMLAGPIASRIFHTGARFLDFKEEMFVLVLIVLCVVFGPLLVFTPQLAGARRTGLGEYGTFAERYVRDFEAKWLRGGARRGERLVGNSDIQSLADLANSYEIIRTMRIAPVTRQDVIRLAVATVIPLVPLALTMMSLEDLIKRLFQLMF